MSIIAWIVVGVIAGWIAKLIVPSRYGGFLEDMVVGVIGALIGGWIMVSFGHQGVTGFNLHSILVSVLGAIVMLLIYKAFAYRTV